MHSQPIPPAIQTQLLSSNEAEPIERIRTGLSAATIWKCKTPSTLACLRAWPKEQPTAERLGMIHHAMQQLSSAGLQFTPRLYCTSLGQTFASDGQQLWELTSWLPGQADYLAAPNRHRLESAMRALAAIHAVWGQTAQKRLSPTVHDRIARLDTWRKCIAQSEFLATCNARSGFEAALLSETCAALRRDGAALLQSLKSLQAVPVMTHHVLRDIWSQHLLFSGTRVTGVIDYGALRIDEPTTDLVRLLGSLEPFNEPEREVAVCIYEQHSGAVIDRRRFAILDQAATLLSAAQWLQWLLIDERSFNAPRPELIQRWRQFLARYTLLNT